MCLSSLEYFALTCLESESFDDGVNQTGDGNQCEEEEGVRSDLGKIPRTRSFGTFKREFNLTDSCDFAVNGINVSAGALSYPIGK